MIRIMLRLDRWRVLSGMYEQFRDAVNRHGGELEYVRLPDRGIYGNTHFQMSDLNNVEIANLMSEWLHDSGLDNQNVSKPKTQACAAGGPPEGKGPPPGKGPF